MPTSWIKLFRRIGAREQSATGSEFAHQYAGHGAEDPGYPTDGKIEHPTWLIPAYLRRHRSGDRMYH